MDIHHCHTAVQPCIRDVAGQRDIIGGRELVVQRTCHRNVSTTRARRRFSAERAFCEDARSHAASFLSGAVTCRNVLRIWHHAVILRWLARMSGSARPALQAITRSCRLPVLSDLLVISLLSCAKNTRGVLITMAGRTQSPLRPHPLGKTRVYREGCDYARLIEGRTPRIIGRSFDGNLVGLFYILNAALQTLMLCRESCVQERFCGKVIPPKLPAADVT